MAIYNRDNFAALNDAALANALARRQAAVDRAAQRRTGNFEAIGRALPVFGRTAEEGMVPDQYRDDPEYRAARFDYIYGGDRSGLDSFRQARAAREEAERQRAFQAQEAALNRAMQEREGAANRVLQREQHGLSKVTEKAKMLRDINDAEALVMDIENHPEKYGGKEASQLPLARARHARDLSLSMAAESGLFTGTELKPYQGINESEDEQNKQNKQNGGANAQEGAAEQEAPKNDWTDHNDTVSRLYDSAKTMDDIRAADEQFANLEKPKTDNKAYQELIAKKDKATARVKKRMEAEAYAKAVADALPAAVASFKTGTVKSILGDKEKAPGSVDVTINGKTRKIDGEWVRDRKTKTAKFYWKNMPYGEPIKLTL